MAAERRRGRARADRLLVERGLASTVHEAAARIMSGKILATDPSGRERRVEKSGDTLDVESVFRVLGAPHDYVSRGGLKLAGGLDAFGIDVTGRRCLDVGISTGGFTDCLLRRGAAAVVGCDVGYGQTAWKLRNDARVVLFERTHVRDLTLDAPVDLLVIDVSFIGLASLMGTLRKLVTHGGSILALVKPQFELPADRVQHGGVVHDESARHEAVRHAEQAAVAAGLEFKGSTQSPVTGADGNVEYFLWLQCP